MKKTIHDAIDNQDFFFEKFRYEEAIATNFKYYGWDRFITVESQIIELKKTLNKFWFNYFISFVVFINM